MTVSVNRSRVQYTGNGSTTAFNVTFPAITQAEIVVTVTTDGVDSVKTLNTHYTLTAAPFSTGTVTFLTSPTDYTPASSTTITISRSLDFLQSTDYQANDALDATTLETAFDKATLLAQQLDDDKSRMLKFSGTLTDSFDSDDTITTITSSASDRASKYLGFDANGDIATLTSITGVTYTETSIAAGHIIRYSGSAWVNSSILALDDIKLYFGTDSDTSIEWDTTDTALQFQANVEGQPLSIGLYADQGDDNIDKWKLSVADGGVMTFNTKASGSFVPLLTITPHATATSSSVVIAGDLTVDGTTTTVNTANLLVEDPLIVLSKNTTGGSPSNDCGLIIERGDLTNVGMIWDESADEFAFLSSTSEAGSTAGNINMTTFGDVRTGKNYEERSCYKRGFHQSLVFGL